MLFTEVTELFRQYMIAKENAESSVRIYNYRLREFNALLERSKNCKVYLQDVVVEDIEDYLAFLKAKGNAPVSRNKCLFMLRSFYKYCYKKKLVERDISLEVEPVQVIQKERTYLSLEEVDQILNVIDTPLMYYIIKTLASTGLRISECLNLTLDDVDIEKKFILVRNTKSKKDRRVPISDELLLILKDYRHNWRECKGSNYFFGTAKTGRVTLTGVNKALHRATKKLGWTKNVTCHTFRHSFASALCKKKVDLDSVRRILGHSNIATTGIYLHSNMEDLKQAVNSL